MRQLVTSQLLAFHRHRRKATAVLAVKIVAVAALLVLISLQLTAILQQEESPPTKGKSYKVWFYISSITFSSHMQLIQLMDRHLGNIFRSN
jgi:hypothetical protein